MLLVFSPLLRYAAMDMSLWSISCEHPGTSRHFVGKSLECKELIGRGNGFEPASEDSMLEAVFCPAADGSAPLSEPSEPRFRSTSLGLVS